MSWRVASAAVAVLAIACGDPVGSGSVVCTDDYIVPTFTVDASATVFNGVRPDQVQVCVDGQCVRPVPVVAGHADFHHASLGLPEFVRLGRGPTRVELHFSTERAGELGVATGVLQPDVRVVGDPRCGKAQITLQVVVDPSGTTVKKQGE